MTTPRPSVTVIGAGLGGLVLARVLQRHGVPVTVYDLDAGRDARAQGGMLDMHEESGRAALRAAGLDDAFRAEVLPGGEAMRVLDADGTLRLEEADDGTGERPEVQREVLRHLLLDSLAEGTVRWGRKLVAARPLGDGRHELTFGGPGALGDDVVVTDLLVGADGAWSRVRPLVSDAVPVHSGITFATTRLRDVDARHPGPAAVVGGGLMFALGDGKGLIAHREPGAALEVYAAVKGPLDGLDPADHAATTTALLARFDGWDEGLRALISEADEPFVVRPIHALPVGHRWDRVPGVTLLGDAAHLMSPFAGEGANLAMLDGAELAARLVEHGVGRDGAGTDGAGREGADVEAALAAYEAAMFPRAELAAAESAANLEVSFGPDGAQGLLDVMAAHGAA